MFTYICTEYNRENQDVLGVFENDKLIKTFEVSSYELFSEWIKNKKPRTINGVLKLIKQFERNNSSSNKDS